MDQQAAVPSTRVLDALPYHHDLVAYLEANEPEIWAWSKSAEVQDRQAGEIRDTMLRQTYRMARFSAPSEETRPLNKGQELQSLKRGLRAITLINTLGAITIAELSRRLRLPRTTAERMLMTLLAEGFLERDAATKAFFLTAKVHALSDGYAEESQLVAAARPIMIATTHDIGWPLCLAMPMGEHMSIRVTTDSETTLGLNRRHVGTTGAMALVSSGLAFLAFLDGVQRDAMFDMLRRSDNPDQAAIHDEKRMAYLLEQTRLKGFSFGADHGRECSVAVPVMLDGRVRGALLMAYMTRVLTNDIVAAKFVPQLKAVAAAIEVEARQPQPSRTVARRRIAPGRRTEVSASL